jgi:hypothetical protein
MSTITRTLPTGASGTAPTFTAVSGQRGTSTDTTSKRPDISEEMITYENYRTPITSDVMLSNKFGSKPSGNTTFQWMETTLLPPTGTITLTGGAATEDTAVVDDYTLMQLGTKLVVDSTGEVLVVDTAPSSSTVYVTKVGSGNITATTTATFHYMGNVFEQGSNSATAKSVSKAYRSNYMEIFKSAVQETESQQASDEYGVNDWDMQKLNRWKELKEHFELQFLRGVKVAPATGLTGSFYQGYTGGCFDSAAGFIATYFKYSGTAPDENWFFGTYLPGVFAKGSDTKTLYAGSALVTAISGYSKNKDRMVTTVQETTYGKKILNVFSDFGSLNVKWHPMFDGDTFSKQGVVLDTTNGRIQYRYLSANGKSRDFQWRDYGEYYKQADSRKGEWLVEAGFQIEGNEYHSIIEPA